MKIKPAIVKTLTERKTLATGQVDDLRAKLVASETEDAATRKTLAELESEIADIDELLSQPSDE